MKVIASILLFISLSFLFSCSTDIFGDRCKSDDMKLYEKPLAFRILSEEDSTSLIGWYTEYLEDDVEISSDKDVVDYYLDPTGRISLEIYPKEEEDFNSHHQQIYYIHFAQDDTDTLRVEYYLKEGECEFHEYKDLRLFYNDSLYMTYSGESIPYIAFYTTINKK